MARKRTVRPDTWPDMCLGQRILIRRGKWRKLSEKKCEGLFILEEVVVLEVSPSGAHVRLMDQFGEKYWFEVGDLTFVETLVDQKVTVKL